MTDQVENPRAVMGGNAPPDWAQIITDKMALEYSEIAAEALVLLDRAREMPITVTTEEELAAITKLVVEMRDLRMRAIAFHKKEKEYWLRSGEGVDNYFFGIRDRMIKGSDIIGERGNVYNRAKVAEARRIAEAARVKAEQEAAAARAIVLAEENAAREAQAKADRARNAEKIEQHEEAAKAHEVSAAEAAADLSVAVDQMRDAQHVAGQKAADIARVRFDNGTMSTMKQVGYEEIVDREQLDLKALLPFIDDKTLLKALKSWAKITGWKKPMAGAIVEMRDATVYR